MEKASVILNLLTEHRKEIQMGNIISSFKHLFKTQKSSEQYYEAMNTDITGLGGHNSKCWMNVGYWEKAEYYNDANEALADKLAEFCHFSSGSNLLDVGCGCGEQDFYWKKCFPQLNIHAMDITPLHIKIAKKRAETEKSNIRFAVGNACDLGFENETFDRVAALDCAYHFDPREQFMHEAFRVLKKGGYYSASEMLPIKGEEIMQNQQIKGRKGLFIPDANMYTIEQYKAKLEKAGFVDVKYEAVGHIVYKGLAMYFLTRYLHFRKPIEKVRVKFNHNKWQEIFVGMFDFLYGTQEYYFISARKP